MKGYRELRCQARHPLIRKEHRVSCLSCTVSLAMASVVLTLISLLTWPWLIHSCHFALEQTPEVIEGYMPTNISFSSCMGNWQDHRLMDRIHSDVHIFLGDSVYGDDYSYEFDAVKPDWLTFFRLPTHLVPYYALLYRQLSCRKTFRDLFHRVPFVLSIWDDHDYGKDDEKWTNPMKEKSKRMFERFWKLNSKRQEVAGVYGSYEFRDSGASLLIVLPDLHFSTTKERLFDHGQWEWLKALLARHTHSTVILGLSTPLHALRDLYRYEIDVVLAMLNHSNSVIVSGDPHVPSIVHHHSGHVELISSPLALVGPSKPEFTLCSSNCTVHYNQDNYGVVSLRDKTGVILSENGPLLQAHILAQAQPSASTAPLTSGSSPR